MNERIAAFIKRCSDHDYRSGTTEFDKEQFAELIIQECIDVHEDHYGVDIIGDVLKKHFGVKE